MLIKLPRNAMPSSSLAAVIRLMPIKSLSCLSRPLRPDSRAEPHERQAQEDRPNLSDNQDLSCNAGEDEQRPDGEQHSSPDWEYPGDRTTHSENDMSEAERDQRDGEHRL